MSPYNIDEQLQTLKTCYEKIKTEKKGVKNKTVRDALMSGIAMFSLKYPSLLQFDASRNEDVIAHNLKTLYGVEKPPSDTYMREVIDEVDPREVRTGFKALFNVLQKGKALQKLTYLNGHYLLSVDGTGHFSSSSIHCENCCEKHHRNGTITYHHNLIQGAIVHPEIKGVIPVCPEPILKQDGTTKNDCEMTATERFFNDYRREHPHLKTIVLQDALFGKAPHIRRLNALNLGYIIGVKSSDHAHLFKQVEHSKDTQIIKTTDSSGTMHRYRFANNISLNQSNPDLKVNFLEFIQIKSNGDKLYFSWITDQVICPNTLCLLMKAARTRWKIENETFNTLKNQGYQLEHNFGHGNKYLSTNFSFLILLAFLIDQIQLVGSLQFKKALEKTKSKVALWFKLRSLFSHFFVLSWQDLFLSIANSHKRTVLSPNTS